MTTDKDIKEAVTFLSLIGQEISWTAIILLHTLAAQTE